jgi:hypothetical protein
LEQADLAAVVDLDLDVEIALLDPAEGAAQGEQRLADGAGDESRRGKAGRGGGDAEDEDAGGDALLGIAAEGLESDAPDPEQRDAGGEDPGEEEASLDAGTAQLGRGAGGEGGGGERPHESLGEQVCEGDRGQPAHEDRRADMEGDLPREAALTTAPSTEAAIHRAAPTSAHRRG